MRKQNIIVKKIMSVVLACTVAVASVAVVGVGELKASAAVSWAATDIITNGDFETGTDKGSWTSYAAEWDLWLNSWESDSTCWEKEENNNHMIHVFNGLSESNQATITRTIEDVPAGTYRLSFEQSGLADTKSGLWVTVMNASNSDSVLATKELDATSGWNVWETQSTGEFTLDSEATSIKIKISGGIAAAYWGDFDNFVLEKKTIDEGGTEETENGEVKPVAAGIKIDRVSGLSDNFIEGVDVSSYVSQKNSGVKYYDFEGNLLDDQGFFDLLHSCGVNYVRIRVWHNPYDENGNGYGGGNNDIATAKQIGKWATQAGMRVLVDFHYSDFWTDPGKQYEPKAWKGMTVDEKAVALEAYTKNSLIELIDAGVDVGMVQIGNETNGAICGLNATNDGWEAMCKLFNAGCKAVREVAAEKLSETTPGEKIKTVLHFADPQTSGRYAGYAANLDTYNVDYDVFASSYYPFFHGSVANLTKVLNSIATTYGKKIMVAETSWATTLEDGDGHDNQIRKGNNDTAYYSFSVLGQATEVRTVMQAVADVSNEAGIGVFYWEPAWIPVQVYEKDASSADAVLQQNRAKWERYGSGWASSYAGEYQEDAATWYGGSAMDNQAMFDFEGHPLESLKVFNYVKTGTYVDESMLSVTSITVDDVTTDTESEIVMPETAYVEYSDGSRENITVVWNASDISRVKAGGVGTYKVNGTLTAKGKNYNTSGQVTVEAKNYLDDPSLENGTPSWTTSSGIVSRKSDGNQKTGNYCLHFWSGSAFEYTASRTVVLNKGTYKLGAYLQGDGAGDDAKFYLGATVGEGEEKRAEAALKGYKNWQNPEVDNIEITEDGTVLTITVTAENVAAGGWGAWDDFYINKVIRNESSGGGTTPGAGTNIPSSDETSEDEKKDEADGTPDTDPTTDDSEAELTEEVKESVAEKLEVTSEIREGAPETELKTDIFSLQEQVFTKEELRQIANGVSAKVYLAVENISALVKDEDKKVIENAAGEYMVGEYLDINLMKQFGETDASKVTELGSKITIAVNLPESLINTDSAVKRVYKVVRIHDGEATLLDCRYDESTGEIQFDTDRFSTYAIIYNDEPAETVGTGDNAHTAVWVVVLCMACVVSTGAVVNGRKAKRTK